MDLCSLFSACAFADDTPIGLYILLGLIGVPVFASFNAGAGYLVGPTGGYIIGFLFSALTMWAFEKLLGKKLWISALSMLLALLVCYAFGTIWVLLVYTKNNGPVGIATILSWCVIPFIIPDLIKITLALMIGTNKGIRKAIHLEFSS